MSADEIAKPAPCVLAKLIDFGRRFALRLDASFWRKSVNKTKERGFTMIAFLLLGLGALGVVAATGASKRNQEEAARQDALNARRQQIADAEAAERDRLARAAALAAARKKAAFEQSLARRTTNTASLNHAKQLNRHATMTNKMMGNEFSSRDMVDLNGEDPRHL